MLLYIFYSEVFHDNRNNNVFLFIKSAELDSGINLLHHYDSDLRNTLLLLA